MAKSVQKLTPREKKIKSQLDKSFEIFQDRNETYGDSMKRHAHIMASMFPEGVTLETPEDFYRYTCMSAVIGKINRYSENFQRGGHQDSVVDPINMLAMLASFDEESQ